jgi:predicted nucleic acid-binding protein
VLLLDHSAWSRIEQNILDEERKATVADWYARRELATCLAFLLEAGFSARSADNHASIMADLDRLPHVPITPRIERRAREAQRDLAKIGHHRLAPMDLIIAACAESQGAGVLHYDSDYDILAERTTLDFTSEWVAPPGSL